MEKTLESHLCFSILGGIHVWRNLSRMGLTGYRFVAFVMKEIQKKRRAQLSANCAVQNGGLAEPRAQGLSEWLNSVIWP